MCMALVTQIDGKLCKKGRNCHQCQQKLQSDTDSLEGHPLWGSFPCPLAPTPETQKCCTAGLAGTVWAEEISAVLLTSLPAA